MLKTTSENTADVARLVERLTAASIGEVLTFGELDAVIGRSVQNRRYLLVRAMDRVNVETGAVFESVFGVGYRRMEIDRVPNVGVHARKRMRGIARRGSRRLTNAAQRANDLPSPVALQINRELAVLGLLQSLARDSTAAKASVDASSTSPAPQAVVARKLLEALS